MTHTHKVQLLFCTEKQGFNLGFKKSDIENRNTNQTNVIANSI